MDNNFRKVSADFCKLYYEMWNNNPSNIKMLYDNTKITYSSSLPLNSEKEFLSFDSYFNFLKTFMYKFEILNYKYISQPLSDDNILITVTGNINTNNFNKKFTETIIIHKNMWNKYNITNSIFILH